MSVFFVCYRKNVIDSDACKLKQDRRLKMCLSFFSGDGNSFLHNNKKGFPLCCIDFFSELNPGEINRKHNREKNLHASREGR